MKKILFVGSNDPVLIGLVREIKKHHKKFISLYATNTNDVILECMKNTDIKIVVLVGRLMDVPYSPHTPTTLNLVPQIREGLGFGVKIIAASSDKKFSEKLMGAGCDEDVGRENLLDRLLELL